MISNREPDVTVIDPPGPGLGRIRLLGFPDSAAWTTWRADLRVSTRTYHEVLALPLRASGPKGKHIAGAVYDESNRLIVDTERGKQNRAWRLNASLRSPVVDGGARPSDLRADPGVLTLSGRTFFAGHWRDIFGHFLLETLPRLWPDLDYHAFDTFLYYPTRLGRRSAAARLPAYAIDLLGALGADTPRGLVMTDRPVVVQELVVSTPAFLLQYAYSPHAKDPFRRVAERLCAERPPALEGSPRRVYLSRSSLDEKYRSAANERDVEQLARELGFLVVHPQEHPISTQVVLMHNADIIAGCDGSALHLGAFARPGTALVALDSRVVVNQLMIDQLAGLDAVHVLASTAATRGRRARWVADLELARFAFELAGAG